MDNPVAEQRAPQLTLVITSLVAESARVVGALIGEVVVVDRLHHDWEVTAAGGLAPTAAGPPARSFGGWARTKTQRPAQQPGLLVEVQTEAQAGRIDPPVADLAQAPYPGPGLPKPSQVQGGALPLVTGLQSQAQESVNTYLWRPQSNAVTSMNATLCTSSQLQESWAYYRAPERRHLDGRTAHQAGPESWQVGYEDFLVG